MHRMIHPYILGLLEIQIGEGYMIKKFLHAWLEIWLFNVLALEAINFA